MMRFYREDRDIEREKGERNSEREVNREGSLLKHKKKVIQEKQKERKKEGEREKEKERKRK